MARRRRAAAGGGGQGSGMPAGYDKVVKGVEGWNDKFSQWGDDAIDYGQNNQWSQGSQAWYDDQLSGGMANNPWMSRLYGQTEGLDMNRGLDYLDDYLGGGGSGGGQGGGSRPGGSGPRGVSSSGRTSSSGGGGGVRDSTVGQGFFSKHINELFDPSRLDPANDPTMQPMVDAIQREAEKGYWRSATDLANQAEGAGRYGGGLYQGMREQGNETYNNALQSTLAQQYSAARNAALQRQMEALGLVNTRDISDGQIRAQRDAASMSANAASQSAKYGYDAEMDSHRLQAMQMMLGAGQFGMQMGGNMAELMQNGQIAANQIGQGWAQIGQQGYNQAGQFGQLGLSGLNTLGGIYGDAASQRARQQQLAEQQRQWNEGAQSREMNDMIRMMTGLSDMSGANDYPGYMPDSTGAAPEGFNWEDILGGGLAGAGTYFDNLQRYRQQGNNGGGNP